MNVVDTQLWRSREVVRITGATYRQLDYWCRAGLVPGHEAGNGYGFPRFFDYRQIRLVRGLVAVTGAGLTGDALRDAAARLDDPELDWDKPLELAYAPHVTLCVDLPALA